MPRPKAKLPPGSLTDDIEPNNRRWLEEFKVSPYCKENYYANIKIFLRYKGFKEKPIYSISGNDVLEYIDVMLKKGFSPHTRNTLLIELQVFKDFLLDTHPLDFQDKEFLDNLQALKDNVIPAQGELVDEPLDLIQLGYVRKYNARNIEYEYIFELFFQLGIKDRELIICHPKNAIKSESVFSYKGKNIAYNAKIAELIEKTGGMNFHWNSNTARNYLKKITQILREKQVLSKDRDIGIRDLKETHQAFFFTCPACKKEYENTAENWVLARTEIDAEYHIVCAFCRGKTKWTS